MSNTDVLFLTGPRGSPDGWGRYADDLQQGIENLGTRVSRMEGLRPPLSYLASPLAFARDVTRVRRAIAHGHPSVVHIIVEPYLILVPFLPLSGRKVILTVHGTYAFLPALVPPPLVWLYRKWYARALARVDTVIAVSEFTKKYLLECLARNGIAFDAGRIKVVPNGICVADYMFQERTVAHETKRILTVAPLKSRKGIIEALRAVARYRDVYGGAIEYRIIGGYDPKAPEARKVIAEVARLGLSDIVVFTGRISDDALRVEYEAADLFLMLPIVKKPYFEGFGLVYLEANACGVPVIGSREGGSAEAIRDGESGFLVEAHDAEAAAQRIHDILAGRLSRALARAWAEAHDTSVVAAQVATLYR